MTKKPLRITFILPGFIRIPVGGVKVVHEYANQLAKRGHRVTLIYPLELKTTGLFYAAWASLVNVFDNMNSVIKELYYTCDPQVNILVVKQAIERYIPEGDAVIAVGWQTAEAVNLLPDVHGRKFYFLQSFETYMSNPKRIIRTYHLPLTKIAISNWILSELSTLGEQAFGPLGNAVNPEEFFLLDPPPPRNYDVMMMYHSRSIKGAADGIAVLKQLRLRYPELQAVMIAPRKPVHRIPDWVRVFIRPSIDDLRLLYNSSKVFMHTSHWEGWGLPVMEAMTCGCAIVAARNRGVSEFLTHQRDALLVPIGDIARLTDATIQLLDQPELREQLVRGGFECIRQYNWNSIVDRFENIIVTSLA
jgi:glycosyltransferase involved in cell wall biosynthesis